MRIRARVDQLGVYVEPGTSLTHATLQHVRDLKRIANLASIVLTAILHHAGAADDLEIGNVCQLGQNVVLHTISKKRVLSIVAEVLKR